MSARVRALASAVAIAVAVVLASPPPARAGSPEQNAKAGFNKGVKLYKAGDYKGALAEFLAAYEAKPHHSVLFNIAQCYQMIDSTAMALHYYEQFLEMGGDLVSESRRKMVEGEIEKLLAELTPITLAVKPDGADVMIDGKSVGISPVVDIQYVDPGEHALMIQLKGYEIYKKTIVAKRGEPLMIDVTLAEEQEPEPEQPAVDAPPGHGTGAAGPAVAEPAGQEPAATKAYGTIHVGKGGVGIFFGSEGTAIVDATQEYASGSRIESGLKMDAGFYVGLFGEKLVAPNFAIGAEASLVVTDVDLVRTRTRDATTGEWSYPNPWLPCANCERPLVFSCALRLKWPFRIKGVVGLYPLVTVGIGTVTISYSERVYANLDTITFFGMSYSGGIGIEFYTPAPVTPFIEIRYMGGFGSITSRDRIEQYWIHAGDNLEKYMVVHHSLVVGIGARFM